MPVEEGMGVVLVTVSNTLAFEVGVMLGTFVVGIVFAIDVVEVIVIVVVLVKDSVPALPLADDVVVTTTLVTLEVAFVDCEVAVIEGFL